MNASLHSIPLPMIDYQPIGQYSRPQAVAANQADPAQPDRPASIVSLSNEPSQPQGDAKVAPEQATFAQEMRNQWPPKRSREEIEEVAAQFVATVFYQPLFQMMRDDPFRSELFHGGHGERVFEGQLHAEMAERMARADSLPLVGAITDRLWQQMQPVGPKGVRQP